MTTTGVPEPARKQIVAELLAGTQSGRIVWEHVVRTQGPPANATLVQGIVVASSAQVRFTLSRADGVAKLTVGGPGQVSFSIPLSLDLEPHHQLVAEAISTANEHLDAQEKDLVAFALGVLRGEHDEDAM
jgi:hypothetical protein